MIDLGAESIRIAVDDAGIALLTIDVPGQAANTMSPGFKAELREVVPRLRAARGVLRGLVITSAKKTFFAGGDLRALVAVQPDGARAFYEGLEEFKVALRGLEQLGLPVAVAINGAALGGGWEICLCAHARFCLDDGKLLLGLPEASLGLLPGAGGVSRMVRKLGLRRALPLLTAGRTFGPSQALAWGLLDGLEAEMPAVVDAARRWVLAHPDPVVPWDQPGFTIPDIEEDLAHLELHGAAELYADGHGRYPARLAIYANAVEGSMVDIDTSLRLESRYLASLATGQVSKNMINTFFFQSSQIRGGKARPTSAERVALRTLSIDGTAPAAVMAAIAAATRRVPAVLAYASGEDEARSAHALDAAVQELVAAGRIAAAKAAAVRSAVTVVPAAGAREPGVLSLVQRVAALHPGAVVLMTGEASLQAAVAAGHVGLRAIPDLMHADVVEVVCARGGDLATATRAYDFLQQIGKTPIVVSDAPRGFLHRVGAAAAAEAAALCAEGMPQHLVETAALQTDMAGGVLRLARLYGTAPLSSAPVHGHGGGDGPERVRDAQDRILIVQAIEALRCLEEGVVTSVADANLASVQGLGFPSWTGGAVQYVNQYGLSKFAVRCEELTVRCGERFRAPGLLRRLVESGARTVEIAG